jgi:hypothetical protein
MRSLGGSALVVFQHLAHVVHVMRLSPSAHCLLKGVPELILIGRQPKDGFQATEPGVHERLVVGDPMLHTRGWSCFSQLSTGGVGSGQGNGRSRKRSRSQRVGKNAFQGEPLSFEQNARSLARV